MEKRLIIKFLKNECTAEEKETVVEWLHSRDFESELLSQIENDLLSLNASANNEEDLQPLLQNILLKEQLDRIDSGRQIIYPGRKNGSVKWLLSVAASIIIIFSFSYFLTGLFTSEAPLDTPLTAKYIVKENSRGRMSTIFLPDGSVVKLNAASKIRYQENFIDSARIVYLEGEAFFEVAKDSIKPFVVLADNISITALGTSFNVSSYQEEDKIAVALATGKVVVKEKNQADDVFLEPGQLVKYNKAANQFTDREIFSPKSIYGWKDGILYFKSASLQEVITRLERWFGVEFIVNNNSPLNWSYTGEFNDQSLKSVLESLSFSQNFKYKINDKTVTIDFNTNTE